MMMTGTGFISSFYCFLSIFSLHYKKLSWGVERALRAEVEEMNGRRDWGVRKGRGKVRRMRSTMDRETTTNSNRANRKKVSRDQISELNEQLCLLQVSPYKEEILSMVPILPFL